jgi:hypothetical protein
LKERLCKSKPLAYARGSEDSSGTTRQGMVMAGRQPGQPLGPPTAMKLDQRCSSIERSPDIISISMTRHAGLLEDGLIHVTPDPIFTRLDGLHHGVLGGMKVLGGVLILGGIAAAYVTAFEAGSQVHPGVAHLEALLASLSARFHSRTHLQVMALLHIPSRQPV